MNAKTPTLLVLCLLLVTQTACSTFLGQNGAGPQPLYTLTSLPPFPTATETPLPSPTVTVTSTPRPTRTPIPTATRLPTLRALATQPGSATPAASSRAAAPVTASYLASPPKMDGDWGEWKGVTNEYPANHVVWGNKNWSGPEDLSASFHLGWDDNYLYLAIKVRDDHYVQTTTGANLFNGDSLELLLDTQLTEDYGAARLSDDDFQLGLSPGRPKPGAGQEAYLWAPNYLAKEQKSIEIESRWENGLYRAEVAIPWTVFEMKPVAGKHYGFGLSVSDNDNGDGGVQQSMISNLPERNPGDPTTWGDLLLVK